MCKPENSNAEASNSGATTGDALNNADNTTIDYNKIAADAIQSHNAVLEPLESVLGSLEVVYENRNWISGHIVTSAGDIVIPQLFPTTTDKIKLLEQADKYFVAANETEKSLRTITRSLQATLGRAAALALITEVHQLLHQEGEVGDLLRDLDSKGLLKVMVIPKPNKGEHTISFSPDADTEDDDEKRALLEQASENLRETMKAYPKDTMKSMVKYAFKDQTDESVWPYNTFYLLYTNKFHSIRDARTIFNMQLFTATMLATFGNSINQYKEVKNALYAIINSAAETYTSAQNSSQE